jgi:dTDP-4-amino-4,6-dideoxygalactose transaminase
MIPRTRPNYNVKNLIRSFFSSEKSDSKRNELLNRLQKYFNHDKILLTPSGRGGLYILLSCLDQRKVFIPAYTCKAVVEAVNLAGKSLEFIEIENGGFNADVEDLKGRLDSDSIVLITHQFGFCANIDALTSLALEAKSVVLEDAAASFGSRYNGRLTGTIGKAGFFSFDSTKLLNTPLKGGFIVFNDNDLYLKAKEFIDKSLTQLPFLKKVFYFFMGLCLCIISHNFLYSIFHWVKFKRKGLFTDEALPSKNRLGEFYIYKLSEFQAATLIEQIETVDTIISRRLNVYGKYRNALEEVDNIILPPAVTSYGDVPIRFPIRISGDKIDFYRKCLDLNFDLAFSFTFLDCPETYVKSLSLAKSVVDLPFYYSISDQEVDHVICGIKRILEV